MARVKSKKSVPQSGLLALKDFVLYCGKCRAVLECQQQVLGMHLNCFIKAFPKAESEQGVSQLQRLRTGAVSPGGSGEDSVREKQYLGHFPKYALRLGGEEYIAKIGKINDYPLIALTEKLCNDIASNLDIDVPEYHLIYFKDRPCFLVKNFLNHREFSNLIHIAQYWPREKNGRLTEYLLETLIEIVRKKAGYPAVRKIVEVVIFDYLIGNGDRHRENFGFIRKKDSLVLSPIYDSVSDLGLESEEFLDPSTTPP